MNSQGGRSKIAAYFRGSMIVYGANKLTTYVYKKISTCFLAGVFSTYDGVSRAFEKSAVVTLFKSVFAPAGRAQRAKRRIAECVETSFIRKLISNFIYYIGTISSRVFATFMLSCGIYSLIAFLIKYFGGMGTSVLDFAICSMLIILSIPLMFSDSPLMNAISESVVFRWLIISVGGVRPDIMEYNKESRGRKNIAFILGIPFGIVSFFISPLYIIAAIFALCAAYLVLISPEIGLLGIIFVMPFLVVLPHPSIVLALLTIYTAVSFGIKILLGRRQLKFEMLDVAVLLFALAVLLGGLFSIGGMGSLKVSLIQLALMLGYFLATGLLRTQKWVMKAVYALTSSAALVSLYGLYQYFTGNISSTWLDTDMFDNIAGRVVSMFENPNMLAEYLILIIPVTLALAFSSERGGSKLAWLGGAVIMLACLVYTYSRGAWLGFAFAVIVFLLMYSKHFMNLIFLGIIAIPFLPSILPASILSRITSIGNMADTSTSYRVYIWQASLRMFGDYPIGGIGEGEAAFRTFYPTYAFSGIERAPHSHNLFLQILIEIGLFGFVLFILFLFLYSQSALLEARVSDDKKSRLITCGLFCGVLGALAQGMTDYVWYNYRIFFIFFVIIGICSASQRVCADSRARLNDRAKNEKDSAQIDIEF